MTEILNSLKEKRLIAVIRAESPESALTICKACVKGGIDIIEITYSVPKASEVIGEVKRLMGEQIALGAGTVLDPETAKNAIEAGAEFIVGPNLSISTARLCSRYAIPYVPGIMTPTEAVTALENGMHLVKAFPANVVGPGFIKALKGPLPQIEVIPTGGISKENIAEWLKAGAFAIGVGGSLTKGSSEEITGKARELVTIASSFAG
ncbi:MAG TPA: 2-dehydro-3-deoxyphosphogluconate aldolase [Kosmotogaceae bacterium]|nr:MAG: 2-dehydro-3-deoxyphosphogluconate aldolase/4-hydroxy-2-oxoglutarate aldolase [Thermotogales bacterium 46_20]HAA84996.1 2-dehydro-3-deoxyphosphogluconate aldolase [Kosmotogaceae bacterium]